jgi:hypothetical protein
MSESGRVAEQPSTPGSSGQGRLARAGGWLLLGSGVLMIVGYISEVATADRTVQGWGVLFAPLVVAIGALPLLAGVGAVRRHRKAQIVGALIGWLFGRIPALAWLGEPDSNPLSIVFTLPFLFGAMFLTVAISRHEV